jgi:1,4-alpha-glucan branching enzyme
MVDYAHRRIKEHIGRFTRLYNELNSNKIDSKFLAEIEAKDLIFPDIDYRLYS